MKRKALSLVLALVMCLGLALPALAVEAAYEVTDAQGKTYVFSNDPVTTVKIAGNGVDEINLYVVPDGTVVSSKSGVTTDYGDALYWSCYIYDYWDNGYEDVWGMGSEGAFSGSVLDLGKEGAYIFHVHTVDSDEMVEGYENIGITVATESTVAKWDLLNTFGKVPPTESGTDAGTNAAAAPGTGTAPGTDAAAGAYTYNNGVCVYELSAAPIGTVELKDHRYDYSVTAFVVPDNTTVTAKSTPNDGMTGNEFAFDDEYPLWDGGPDVAAGEAFVVVPYAEWDGTQPVAYELWTLEVRDPNADGVAPRWDYEMAGIAVVAQSAVTAAGVTVQPLTDAAAPSGTAPTTPTTPAVAPGTPAAAVLSPQKLAVDGKEIECEKYNIDGRNYFKLRDLAYVLTGTGSQFDVGFENNTVTITTGSAYTTATGTELAAGADNAATAQTSAQTIMIDGAVRSDLTVYNIGGSNFFQLRELGEALGFTVGFDADTNTATVTSK